MTNPLFRVMATIGLLVASNTFMTFAWYYHLKQKAWALVGAILISWLIALPEYCLQVPANRVGHMDWGGPLGAPQLKIIQEAITLLVFSLFSVFVLRERLRTTDMLAFLLVFAGVAVMMWGRSASAGG